MKLIRWNWYSLYSHWSWAGKISCKPTKGKKTFVKARCKLFPIILRKCVVQPVFVTSLAGVSVCLRYMTDAVQPTFPLFTLSPDTSSLSLQRSFDTFMLSYYDSFSVDLQPIVHLWPDIKQEIWTSVCLTVDTSKSVVQMFSGGYMSPRKVMPYQVRMSTKLESAC